MSNFLWYYLELDESTNLLSTSHLYVIICGVNVDFQITEDMASICITEQQEDIFIMEVQTN